MTLPVAAVYYLWRIFIARKANESWRHNFGALPNMAARRDGVKLIWIHAASVGEVVASLPVQDELRRLIPEAMILVTTITQTGNAVARKVCASADEIGYLPLDYLPFVNRALNRVRPDVFVMVESEIWPNLLAAVKRRRIPTVLINGRFSDSSFKRSSKWRWLISWAVSNIDRCCAQTELDMQRLRAFGAHSVSVVGSTKFDAEDGALPPTAIRALRDDLGLSDAARAIVAGSTNPGEEEILLAAFRTLRRNSADIRLILAPRQMERVGDIHALVESCGYSCARRSIGIRDWDVLILDTYGELASVYAIGEIAFVGGTLVRKGGHSIIQPIIHGKPVLFGPHTFKTRTIAQMAIDAGVGFTVNGVHDLAATAATLLADERWRAEIESACVRLVRENRGASARCACTIMELMGERMEIEHAA